MTNDFAPRLDILPKPARRLWDELATVPPEFVLYGGTAVALHLGHRQSADFDFFGNRPFGEADSVHSIHGCRDEHTARAEYRERHR